MAIVFDGPALEMRVTSLGTYDVQLELYSAWKDWSQLDDNRKYPIAFDPSEGGSPTRPPETTGGYFFLRNDLGWRIRMPNATGGVIFEGNLYARDATLGDIFTPPTLGAHTVVVSLNVSNLSLTVPTSGLTATESASLTKVEALMANKAILDPNDGMLTIYDSDGVTPLYTAQAYEDTVGLIAYRGRGVSRQEAL